MTKGTRGATNKAGMGRLPEITGDCHTRSISLKTGFAPKSGFTVAATYGTVGPTVAATL